MSHPVYQLANEYVHFQIEGKRVKIPYSMVRQGNEVTDISVTRTTRFAHFAAKGTPDQIRHSIHQTALKEHFNLKKASPERIHQFMLKHGIGVDCSGFVYQILDRYVRQEKSKSLSSLLLRYSGWKGRVERFLLRRNRVRRISAKTLTSDLNTVKITSVKSVKPGDMLRLTDPHWRGKHIAIIVDVTPKYITYAHASERTEFNGPHFAKIKITDPNKGLEKQVWLEKMKSGQNYGKKRFQPENGDSVRRLRILAEK